MRFGGHETFPIREGWLSRGLALLDKSPEKLVEEYAEDHLGVGKNMAKSIRHWLVATGLADKLGVERGKVASYELTWFGSMVLERDPHLLDKATWWMLHINLVNTKQHAMSWHWFFNHWNHRRFEKAVCIENLRRHMQLEGKRQPSIRTLERDIGCLLASYSRKVPQERSDPEDASECPFQELDLMRHYRGSGYFSLRGAPEGVPPTMLGYCVARSLLGKQWESADFTLTELENMPGGPGRCFGVDAESLHDKINQAVEGDFGDVMKVKGLAGQRIVQLGTFGKNRYGDHKLAYQWAEYAYDRAGTVEVSHA